MYLPTWCFEGKYTHKIIRSLTLQSHPNPEVGIQLYFGCGDCRESASKHKYFA